MRSIRTWSFKLARFAIGCLMIGGLAAGPSDGGAAPAGAPPTPPSTPAAAGEVPADLRDAIRELGKADEAGRRKTYDLIEQRGDARLIPAMKAYRDGGLLLNDGRLMIYGERVNVPGRGSVLPLVDAFTGQPVPGPDGQPQYFARQVLTNALKTPPRSERGTINDLISSLSLLDPDPDVRVRSIQDVGERAARVFIPTDDTDLFMLQAAKASAALKARLAQPPPATSPSLPPSLDEAQATAFADAIAALDALPLDRGKDPISPTPGASATGKAWSALVKVGETLKPKAVSPAPVTPATVPAVAAPDATPVIPAEDPLLTAVASARAAAKSYQDQIELKQKAIEELPKYLTAICRQLEKDPKGRFAPALREAKASLEAVLGDRPTQSAAVTSLGDIGTARAANLLRKLNVAANRYGDKDLEAVTTPALAKAERYQSRVRFAQTTFAGLSAGSILVLLALGLSIVFGLMGVINMAHGEFMMVGAFTTYVVCEWFKVHAPGLFNWYLLAAVPAAFLVAGFVGLLCEWFVIRRLYGRPLETLLATLGVSYILIWLARFLFGDNLSVTPPHWMEGAFEVAPDLMLPRNRVYIIIFCLGCIAAVYLIVNKTKLGLLLRATTQNREMAAALGVATRGVDALTFAFGAGLAGLAGVAVPLYNKINPGVGQEYIVDSFMVVVVGGVGKLAGAMLAGLSMGFCGKYLEALLGSIPSMASGSSVIGRVLLLAAVIVFLQWRPSGLFPPKGRMADA